MVERGFLLSKIKTILIVFLIIIGSSLILSIATFGLFMSTTSEDAYGNNTHPDYDRTMAIGVTFLLLNLTSGSICTVTLIILIIVSIVYFKKRDAYRLKRIEEPDTGLAQRKLEMERRERELKRQRDVGARQEEAQKRQQAERSKQEAQPRGRAQEERRARNYEKALNYDGAIQLYEKLDLWDDAGRCRKLKRKQKLEELEAQRATIDIGSLGTTIKDSVINRAEIGTKKKD